MIELAPSLLAADLMHLGNEIESMLSCGTDLLHFDIMDAHFVPNLSFGPALCREIHQVYPACRLDVHLMMDNPEKYIDAFSEAGADEITIHEEIPGNIGEILRQIKTKGIRCGLSVKPGTNVEKIYPYLNLLDLVLIMTVEPGFGGQKFMPEQIEKIRLLREKGFKGTISVDGGVNVQNAPVLSAAGADRLVMGTSFFGTSDRQQVAEWVKELA